MAKPVKPAAAPEPVNRVIDGSLVKVRARGWIGETINGEQKTFKPGDEFELAAERAAALGNQVTKL
jgi:hypothetical protein